MKHVQVNELLYQALQPEFGGVKVYQTAIGAPRAQQVREDYVD